MLTKDRINRLSEWLKANLADKTTILLLAAVIIMMYAPVWGGYLLFVLLGWRWCFCVASAYLAFWAGPFTPFFPCCIAITIFLKRMLKQ